MSDAESGADQGLPGRSASVNQLVGYNMKWFRKAAGITQEEMGRRLGGWSKGVVSAAERSWDSDRVRQFDADEIVAIAQVLDIPVIGLLLPPPDSGTGSDYVFAAGPARMSSDDLLHQVVPDYQGNTKAMIAFRERVLQVGGARFMEPIQREAERILLQARDHAHQFVLESREAAEGLERDAQDRYRQAMDSLIERRQELERRVDDLRAFEREYRLRQIAYLEGLLSDLRAGVPDSGVFPPLPPTAPGDQP